MSAGRRIEAATNAIAFARGRAEWRDGDVDREAAVELESRGLLTDGAGAPSLAWAKFLDEEDQVAFQSDLYHALVSSVVSGEFVGVDEVLSTWWLAAMGERAQESAPGLQATQPVRLDGDAWSIRNVTWQRIVGGWEAAGGWWVKHRTPEVLAEGWYVVQPDRYRFGLLLEGAESERDALFAATALVLACRTTDTDGSPGDVFDEPSPVSVPPRAGERAAWRMARGESAVNQAGYDPTDAESAGGGLS